MTLFVTLSHLIISNIIVLNGIDFLNSNSSNKSQPKRDIRHLNITSNLASCFLGNCRTANTSVVHRQSSSSMSTPSNTTMGFSSSILESRRSSLNNNVISSHLSPQMLKWSESDLFQPNIIVPDYEECARSFCHITKPNINKCNADTTGYNVVDSLNTNDAVVEIDIELAQSRISLSSYPSINLSDCHWPPIGVRPILRTDRPNKHFDGRRISFAADNDLVTIFEYPSLDFHRQRINEINQGDTSIVNIDENDSVDQLFGRYSSTFG